MTSAIIETLPELLGCRLGYRPFLLAQSPIAGSLITKLLTAEASAFFARGGFA